MNNKRSKFIELQDMTGFDGTKSPKNSSQTTSLIQSSGQKNFTNQFDSDIVDYKLNKSFKFFLSHSWNSLKKTKLSYCLALLSCAIVVCSTAVAKTVIDRAPIIFLKKAESDVGEFDIIIKALDK